MTDPVPERDVDPLHIGVCGEVMEFCVCGLPPGHDPPHHCIQPMINGVVCDGQWETNPFRPVRWPGGQDVTNVT